MPRRNKLSEADVISYAEDLVCEALHTGYVDPILLVECVHYAAEPDLIAFTRSFASLDESARAEVTRIVQALSGERTRPSPSRRSAH